MKRFILLLFFVIIAIAYYLFKSPVSTTEDNIENPPINQDLSKKEAPTKIIKKEKINLRPKPRKKLDYDMFKHQNGKMILPIKKEGNLSIALGDLIIPENQTKDQLALIEKPTLWDNQEVPYSLSPNLTNFDEINKAIEYLNEQLNIKFVLRTHQEDFLYFKKGDKNCYSYVGKLGGKQDIFLSEKCHFQEILHEIVHALGFFHEHSRFDRDNFIQVHWNNIEKEYWPQFKRIPEELTWGSSTPFNIRSVMMYPPNAFARDQRFATISTSYEELYWSVANGLSDEDIQRINDVYR